MVVLVELLEGLYWFKWEVYFIWIIGFLFLLFMYYYGVDVFLIDKFKVDLF